MFKSSTIKSDIVAKAVFYNWCANANTVAGIAYRTTLAAAPIPFTADAARRVVGAARDAYNTVKADDARAAADAAYYSGLAAAYVADSDAYYGSLTAYFASLTAAGVEFTVPTYDMESPSQKAYLASQQVFNNVYYSYYSEDEDEVIASAEKASDETYEAALAAFEVQACRAARAAAATTPVASC
jgi:hypothetical protein